MIDNRQGQEQLLTLEQVAVEIGVSGKTLNNWYWYKNRNPEIDNQYTRLLPDYIQQGERQTRYWRKSDIPRLVEFKNTIPRGRNGIMASVTQKYLHKGEKEN